MTMGEKIKMHRIMLGLSQEELGVKLGVAKAAVQKWEKGTVENIKRSNIKILADLFQITPSELMCWEEEYNPNNKIHLIQQIQKEYGKDAAQLIQTFIELNNTGKKKSLDFIADLAELQKYRTDI